MSADHSSNTLLLQASESGRVQTTAASPTLLRSNASCEMSSPPTAILDMQTALQVQQARTHLIIPWLVHLAAACMILCLLARARRTLLITLPHCASPLLTSQSRSREEGSCCSSCNDNFGCQCRRRECCAGTVKLVSINSIGSAECIALQPAKFLRSGHSPYDSSCTTLYERLYPGNTCG